MSTIPASAVAKVTPAVLSAGGTALDVIGLMLTDSDRVPIGSVQPFSNAIDVSNYFGASSTEFALAEIYFDGFDNSFVKPARLLFAQYPTAAVPAWLRGGKLALTLQQLQALATGTIALFLDGATITAPSVVLSSATSFSNAAQIMEAAFTNTQASASQCSISGTTLTVGGSLTGAWAPGQTVAGSGVTAGTVIESQLSGTTGGAGTYQVSTSQTVAGPEAMTGGVIPVVAYDSVAQTFTFTSVLSGSAQTMDFAASPSSLMASLMLTEATGAVVSNGADAATPSSFMDGIVQVTQDWASFMTTFDPDVSGNANKLAFAEWNGLQNNRWAYVCWDVDTAPAQTVPASASLGQLLKAANVSGTCLIGGDGTNPVTASYAAFGCGYGASLDFGRANGRTTLAFRKQSGLVATASTQSTADNLMANGYNFYGVYATANEDWIFFYPGSVSGEFLWMDSYVDEIWMNNSFQVDIMTLFQNAPSIPYNQQGYSLIEAALLDTINEAVNFGAIRAGVTLSQQQIADVNAAAGGINVATTLNQRGWYLQVQDASPTVRAARGSPPVNFWYMDGQSVQQINLFSEELV